MTTKQKKTFQILNKNLIFLLKKINIGNFFLVGPLIGNDRILYLHSLASVRESWVKTSIIRNESLFLEGNGSPKSFMVSKWERPSQSAAEAMTSNGILFFGLLGNNSIACWNSKLPYAPENMVIIAKVNH